MPFKMDVHYVVMSFERRHSKTSHDQNQVYYCLHYIVFSKSEGTCFTARNLTAESLNRINIEQDFKPPFVCSTNDLHNC